eukprot:TRINITY_DN3121_c0_g1_i1.p2 TRINITY_DN3121_c0_g1~~TRINITY_DN3121_c0_g1_i1.p2  ORF type:complete len:226 (+),score=44.16 TRINITY_DN3121_c0_g1_i1:57-734(+)
MAVKCPTRIMVEAFELHGVSVLSSKDFLHILPLIGLNVNRKEGRMLLRALNTDIDGEVEIAMFAEWLSKADAALKVRTQDALPSAASMRLPEPELPPELQDEAAQLRRDRRVVPAACEVQLSVRSTPPVLEESTSSLPQRPAVQFVYVEGKDGCLREFELSGAEAERREALLQEKKEEKRREKTSELRSSFQKVSASVLSGDVKFNPSLVRSGSSKPERRVPTSS